MKLVDIEKFDNSKPQLYSDDNYISIEHDICEKMYEFEGVDAIPVKYLQDLADILDSDEVGDWSPVEVIRLIIDAWKECNGNKGSD